VSVPNFSSHFETAPARRLTRAERRELRVLETLPFPLTPDQIARKMTLAVRADTARDAALARQDRRHAWMHRWHLDTLGTVARYVAARCGYLAVGGLLGLALFLPWQERVLAQHCTPLAGEELRTFVSTYTPDDGPLLPTPASPTDGLVGPDRAPRPVPIPTHGLQVLVCRW
jgi:hypothetical protein